MSFWNKIKSVGNWVKNHSGTLLGIAQTAFECVAPGSGLITKYVSKALGKASSVASQVTNFGKDLVLDSKVSGLQDTASALKNSQSLLNGQVTELQAGLKEAKDNELALAAEQQRLAQELTQATAETKAELELQKAALEQARAANKAAKEQMQTALDATKAQIEEMQNRMADNEQAIAILQNTSLSQEEKISSLNDLMESERQRMEDFENQMANFNQRLVEQETKLNEHSEQINSLHQKHCELEKKVQENKVNIEQNKRGIQKEQNQRKIAVAEVKITAIEAHEKVDKLAREQKQKEKERLTQEEEWERQLAAERTKNEKRNQELAAQLEVLRQEILAEKLAKEKAAEYPLKLAKYTELKEEKIELEKKLGLYENNLTLEEIDQELKKWKWINRTRAEIEVDPTIVNQYVATPNSFRGVPRQLVEANSWAVGEKSAVWKAQEQFLQDELKEKIEQTLLPLRSDLFAQAIGALTKKELLDKWTTNRKLLWAIAQDLELEPELEETPSPEEKPSAEQPKPTLPKKIPSKEKPKVPVQPKATGPLKLAVRQSATDLQQLFLKIPGATLATSFSWQIWLLLLLLLWLLKKLIWFYLFQPKVVIKSEAKKKETKPSETKVKPKPPNLVTKPKKGRKRSPQNTTQ